MSFDTIWDSLMSNFLIFINEEWHLFLIDYAHFKSKLSIIYFILLVIVIQLFLMKMFSALMINKFCRSNSIKYLIKNNENKHLFTFNYWERKIKYIKEFICSKIKKRKKNVF